MVLGRLMDCFRAVGGRHKTGHYTETKGAAKRVGEAAPMHQNN